jgi:hypothetical protein
MIFSIFDDSKCRININLGLDINDPTIIIENRAFISILKEKFEKLWEEADKNSISAKNLYHLNPVL